MGIKTYDVYYIIKMNGAEQLYLMKQVKAANAKEACKHCKEQVRQLTGRNAFRPTTHMTTDEITHCFGNVVYPTLPSRKF